MFVDSLSFYAKESTDDKYFGLLNITPSALCRSNEPNLHAGYVILNPDAVNKGYGTELMVIYGMIGVLLGFEGKTFT